MQELFEKYDTSGDGTMSEDEMVALLSKFLGIPGSRARDWFKAADGNKDGVVQVHEFISWLTKNPPMHSVQEKVTESGKTVVQATIVNTSGAVGQVFTFTIKNHQNVSFPKGNPVTVVVRPGEQVTETLLEVEAEPFKYQWFPATYRSDWTGVEDDPNAFRDPGFPHHDSSILDPSRESLKLGKTEQWMRARMLGDPGEAVLFDGVRPQDVQQGHVGDCWLICALGALATHPEKLKSLFHSKHVPEDGKYRVWLFDIYEKRWTQVEVDEFLPCEIKDGRPIPTFARPLGNELWVLLLEKALAKFCGSYGKLSAGFPCWAFQVLTGKIDFVAFLKQGSGWRKCQPETKITKEDARNPRFGQMRYSGWGSWGKDDLYKFLKSHIEDKHVFACSIQRKGAGVEAKLANGLLCHHAYALLKIISETLDDGSPVRLVQLANPHHTGEWKGDWSDYQITNRELASRRWAENPELTKRIGAIRSDDGTFFMSFDDWEANFTKVVLCPVGSKPIPLDEATDDADDDEEPQGFFSSLFGW